MPAPFAVHWKQRTHFSFFGGILGSKRGKFLVILFWPYLRMSVRGASEPPHQTLDESDQLVFVKHTSVAENLKHESQAHNECTSK